ncbi:hypothetical protein BDN72DRAFT_839733 [Pluteus cervinus]|uniref:Uncharacterized protein n=1 Tax=Pluteus cervinus TaxID=181527 RepID=A0ACD3AW74_9AGAR|nr:hypothetical protein BDN72DRAFT_839733 [Pluteus cervinus]
MATSLDGTLGMVFVGMCVSTILFGATCVQIFMYATSSRCSEDRWFLKTFVCTVLLLDTAHQIGISMGMYRFFITDYANPMLLNDTSHSGGAL